MLHGVLSMVTAAGVSKAAGRVPPKTVYAALVAAALAGTALAGAALTLEAGTARTALLVAGTGVGLGIYDLGAQGLVRGQVGKEFQGTPEIEAAMAFLLLCLCLGNVLFFSIGSVVPPEQQAVVVAVIGVAGLVGFLVRDEEGARPGLQ